MTSPPLAKAMMLLFVLHWAVVAYLWHHIPYFKPLSAFMSVSAVDASLHSNGSASRGNPPIHKQEHRHRTHGGADRAADLSPPSLEAELGHHAQLYDAVVVGGGLGGIVTALTVAQNGGSVVLIEKEPYLGGNSRKASSGINGLVHRTPVPVDGGAEAVSTSPFENNDSVPLFVQDTSKSFGNQGQSMSTRSRLLIQTLVEHSSDALSWLEAEHAGQNPSGLDSGTFLSLVSQLGGHSVPRTYRPSNGMIGSSLIATLVQRLDSFKDVSRPGDEQPHRPEDRKIRRTEYGSITVVTNATVTSMLKSFDQAGLSRHRRSHRHGIAGVACSVGNADGDDPEQRTYHGRSVVMATGGFAANTKFVHEIRPDLQSVSSTTSGNYATGDGLHLGFQVGAMWTDMEYIQVHPTGFVDPADPSSNHKVLAAEVLRGVGGILLDSKGRRFCNELGTRKYISDLMLSSELDSISVSPSTTTEAASRAPVFALVLSSDAAAVVGKHLLWYKSKGLMQEVVGVDGLARWLGDNVDPATVEETLRRYRSSAASGEADEFGKTVYENVFSLTDPGTEVFHVGLITPVLHYCMGGLGINRFGQVLGNDDGRDDAGVIPGLYAVGEVTGGLHGENRLGGNSLLECVVYGRVIGHHIMGKTLTASEGAGRKADQSGDRVENEQEPKHRPVLSDGAAAVDENTENMHLSMADVQKHSSGRDCWVAVHGRVLDVSVFADMHPGGAHMLRKLCGKDGSELFSAVHEATLLDQPTARKYRVGTVATHGEDDGRVQTQQ